MRRRGRGVGARAGSVETILSRFSVEIRWSKSSGTVRQGGGDGEHHGIGVLEADRVGWEATAGGEPHLILPRLVRGVELGEADLRTPAAWVDDDEGDAAGDEAGSPHACAVAGGERGRDALTGASVLFLEAGKRDGWQGTQRLEEGFDLVAPTA